MKKCIKFVSTLIAISLFAVVFAINLNIAPNNSITSISLDGVKKAHAWPGKYGEVYSGHGFDWFHPDRYSDPCGNYGYVACY